MDQNILYDFSPSMMKSNPIGFFLGLAACLIFIGIPIMVVWYIRNKNTRLIITETNVTYCTGLVSKDEKRITRDKISRFDIHQGGADRIFDVCKVSVYTSGDYEEFAQGGLPFPEELKEIFS